MASGPSNRKLWKRVASHWEFYLLLLPAVVITIIFKYIPIYGVQIAFRDYNAVQGFFGSPWVGLDWFERFFNNCNSFRMIRNRGDHQRGTPSVTAQRENGFLQKLFRCPAQEACAI